MSNPTESHDQAIRDIVKGAGIIYTGLILEVVISFVAQVLAANFLSVSDFGGVKTGEAVLKLGVILSALGLNGGLIRFLPRVGNTEKRILARTAYLISVPVGILIGGVLALNAKFIAVEIFGDPNVVSSIRIFAIAIPFGTAMSVALGGIRGQQRASYRVYLKNVIRPIVRIGLVIIAVIYGLDQTGFATAYAAPHILGGIIGFYFFARSLPGIFSSFQTNRSLIRRYLRYSFPLTISRAAGFVYLTSDTLLIVYFLNSEAMGAYGVAYAAANLISMFYVAFGFLNTPISSKIESISGSDDILSVQQPILRWLAILTIIAALPLVIFSGDFITSIYSARYIHGALPLAILAAGFAVHNVTGTQSDILQALGLSRILAAINVFAAVLNLVLNVVLIPHSGPFGGIVGAAIATVVAYIIRDSLGILVIWYQTHQWLTSRTVIVPALLSLPFLATVEFFSATVPDGFLWLIVVTIIFAFIYLSSVILILGFQPEEVMLIKSVEERYGLDLGPLTTIVERFSD